MILRIKARIALAGSIVGLILLGGCATPNSTSTAGKRDPSPRQSPRYDEVSEDTLKSLAHYGAGLSFDMRDDSAAALEEYIKAAEANPKEEKLVLEVGRRLLRSKQNDRAIEILTKAAAQSGSSGLVDSWLGLAYAAAGQTNKAIAANRAAIQKMPGQITAYANLCELYLQIKKTNEVPAVLDEAAKQKEAPAEFFAALAEVVLRMQARDAIGPDESKKRAVAALDRAVALKPQDILLRQRIGDAYIFHSEPAKAEAVYEKIFAEHPETPGARERLINIYLRTNKSKAAKMLEDLRTEAPTNPRPHMILGQLAVDEERYAEGLEHLETALKLNPSDESLYYRVAALKVTLKKPQEAIQVLDKAKEVFGGSGFLQSFYTGIAKAALEKFDEAVRHFAEAEIIAKAREPERLTASFYFQLGSASERAKDIEQAVKYFRRALELEPDFAEALNYLGYMWAERGENLKEAHDMIEKALKEEPKNAAFLDSMAWVLFKLNRTSEALIYMEKAIENTKEPDPTLYDHLGDILAALKRNSEARAAWEKALKLEPKEEIRKKLETGS